jgi:periplasmic copper chaperone A
MTPRLLALGAVLLVSVFAGPGARAAQPRVQVRDGWIRVLPAGLPSAGYLTLINDGDVPAVLLRATSPAFQDVSIHQTIRDGGRVGMKPAGRITIPPHGHLVFADAGYHLMLMSPTRSIAPTEKIAFRLDFDDGSSLDVMLAARAAGE